MLNPFVTPGTPRETQSAGIPLFLAYSSLRSALPVPSWRVRSPVSRWSKLGLKAGSSRNVPRPKLSRRSNPSAFTRCLSRRGPKDRQAQWMRSRQPFRRQRRSLLIRARQLPGAYTRLRVQRAIRITDRFGPHLIGGTATTSPVLARGGSSRSHSVLHRGSARIRLSEARSATSNIGSSNGLGCAWQRLRTSAQLGYLPLSSDVLSIGRQALVN